jgi:hypothetical protein
MIESIVDNRNFKIFFGTFVAFPATIIFLLCSLYAVAFTVALFRDFNQVIAPLTVSYYLGLLGFIGAWIRLIKKKQTIGARLRIWVQSFLISGLLSSTILAGMFIFNEWYIFLLLPIGLFAIGVGFICAT